MTELEKEAKALVGSKIKATGHIHRVTYKGSNYQPGDFAIIRFECDEVEGKIPQILLNGGDSRGILLTFAGATPSLSPRTTFQIVGELSEHSRFGFQYKIVCMTENFTIDNKEDAAKFFAYVFPEITANNLLEQLEDPIAALEKEDVRTLCTVRGIGPIKARKIIDKYKEIKINTKAYIELYEYGLTATMIKKMVLSYQSPEILIEKIKENPYLLIYDVKGIGWKKADQIAYDMGIKDADPRRISAYIYYVFLQTAEEKGDTCITFENVLEEVLNVIPDATIDQVRKETIGLLDKGILFYEKETRRIGLKEYRVIEENIASELYRLASANSYAVKDIDVAIAECEKKTGFTYSDEQKLAIRTCLEKNVCIVSGMAGCGKSSIMYPVTKAMSLNYRRFVQCALSGKAALNLTEITGCEGSTIHRLLGYDAIKNRFTYNENKKLPQDLIILDETSMVDEYLFLSLLKAIPSGSKLIMLGDTGQLEPIGMGCLFRDMINSECIEHICFTKIFRQALRSGIISEAAKVYKGEQIIEKNQKTNEIRGELQDFCLLPVKAENIEDAVISEYKRFIEEFNANAKNIIVVTGKRTIGPTSTQYLNNRIQQIVNGEPTIDEITIHKNDDNIKYTVTFKQGDRVLVTKNCYDTYDLEGNLTPVFNGNIGTILEISEDGMKIEFLHDIVYYPRSKYMDLELGYAITCHKIQGSGIPYVITVCDWGSYSLLSKEWLYTAITRAKKFNTLIGEPGAIRHACEHTSIIFKQTWLKDLLIDNFEKI